MKRFLVIQVLMIFVFACTPSTRNLYFPHIENQYLVSCSLGHNCFRKADLICDKDYHLRAMRPFDLEPYLIIECQ